MIYRQLMSMTLPIEPLDPTTIIASLSGGKDSVFMLLKILEKYQEHQGIQIIAHHQVVVEDWPGTVEYNQVLCAKLGVPLIIEQAHYYGFRCCACNGKYLSSNPAKGQAKCPVVLEKLSDGKQRRCGALAQGELIAQVSSLLDLMKWRSAWPSKPIRFCTSYLKRDVFNKFARRERTNWGAHPVVALGERWAESPGRAKLPYLEPRSGLEWLTEWHPILSYKRIEVFRGLRAAGIDPHPCYRLQGMSDAEMYETDAEGGARMSCVCCFFNTPQQLLINATQPGNESLFQSILNFEAQTGHTVKKGLSMAQILGGERSAKN